MSPVVRSVIWVIVRVPRASGDEPRIISSLDVPYQCSPRERG